MRFQLIILSLLFTLNATASQDKEIRDLFRKYDLITLNHQTQYVDEVFTEKFLKTNGGKEEFIEKVKEVPKYEKSSLTLSDINWKKGVKDNIFFVNRKEAVSSKRKLQHPGPQFIVVEEDGKLKIDGTLSDADGD